tara:strand:- start:120 stop:284 length:165 start_codon:yes stop_codon:yes gene_type:complete
MKELERLKELEKAKNKIYEIPTSKMGRKPKWWYESQPKTLQVIRHDPPIIITFP